MKNLSVFDQWSALLRVPFCLIRTAASIEQNPIVCHPPQPPTNSNPAAQTTGRKLLIAPRTLKKAIEEHYYIQGNL